MAATPKSLTDRHIESLPFAKPPQREYYVRDVGRDRVRGLMLRIGKTTKAWVFQSEERKGSTRRLVYKPLGRFPAVKVDDARAAAKLLDAAKANKEFIPTKKDSSLLKDAWENYAQALQDRGSTKWAAEVRGYYNRNLKSIGDRRLASLSASVPGVTEELRDMFRQSTERGEYEANRAFKLLNIVYRYARAFNMLLPPDPPCAAFGKLKLWHEELAAEEECIPKDKFAAWAATVEKVEHERNPLRAAHHRLCVLTGARPGELARIRWDEHVDWQNRLFYLRGTKTRKKKADKPIIVPMSARIAQQLNLARKAGAVMHPGSPFVFPADSESGHLVNWKEDQDILDYWGKSGRHTYTTYAGTLPISNKAVRRMQGHVDKGDPHEFNYKDVREMVDDFLRPAQRVISRWLWSQMYPPQKEAAQPQAA
jgi:integrase